jgi:prepilin peptidase CpaA
MTWANLVVLAACGLSLYAAWADFRKFTIRNELVLALAGLFLLHALLAGLWPEMWWDLAFAAVMFAALLVLYAMGGMGGGDVKLLAVAFLWTGVAAAMPFAIALAILSVLHGGAAKLGWVAAAPASDGRLRIPYAPSIAGALVVALGLRFLA